MQLREQLGHLMLDRQAMLTHRDQMDRQIQARADQEAREALDKQREVERAQRACSVMAEAFTHAEEMVITQDQRVQEMLDVLNAIKMDTQTAKKIRDIRQALEKDRDIHKLHL